QGIFTVLDNISKKHRYTLVVFWKDLKGTVDFSEEEISPLIDRDDLIAVENGLVLYLNNKIQEKYPNKFVFTHYQAPYTIEQKREYSKAEAIVFLGYFPIDTRAISRWQDMHKSSMKQKDHALLHRTLL